MEKIGGKEYGCLLDTGATKSIISPEVYLNHPNRNDLALRECMERLVSIDKSPVAVRGEVRLEVDLCGTILVGQFMIAEMADEVVLGIGLQKAGGPLHQPANISAVEVLQGIGGQSSGDTPP